MFVPSTVTAVASRLLQAGNAYGARPSWRSWSIGGPSEIVVLVLLLSAACAYLVACRRARARSQTVEAGSWLPFAAGLLVVAVACFSPIDAIGDTWLLSVHMLQHLLLAYLAPGLLVLGLRSPVFALHARSGETEARRRRTAPYRRRAAALRRIVGRPWTVLPVAAFATWVWAIPQLFDFASEHPLLHDFEHATLFCSGLAMWWLIVAPRSTTRRTSRERLTFLGFGSIAAASVCIPLLLDPSPAYPLYAKAPRLAGLSALADQRLAAIVVLLAYGVAFLAIALRIRGGLQRRAIGFESGK